MATTEPNVDNSTAQIAEVYLLMVEAGLNKMF